jgi:hypothetical protein
MSKFDELIASYHEVAKKLGISVDSDLLIKVTKGLGPSIYNKDSAKVASSDKKELERVKTNFLSKKLGVTDDTKADALINEVIETFGSSNTNKPRPLFYYLLVKKAGKESIYA